MTFSSLQHFSQFLTVFVFPKNLRIFEDQKKIVVSTFCQNSVLLISSMKHYRLSFSSFYFLISPGFISFSHFQIFTPNTAGAKFWGTSNFCSIFLWRIYLSAVIKIREQLSCAHLFKMPKSFANCFWFSTSPSSFTVSKASAVEQFWKF